MSHRYISGIIVFFLFSAFQLTSCYNAPVSDEIRKKEVASATTISIEMPEQESPGTYALNEKDEYQITFLDVLVFDETDLFMYRASGYEITDSPYGFTTKSFKADLRHTYNGDKVNMVILANARFLIGATTAGETKQEIMERINFKLPDSNKWLANSASDFEPFPMWGQTPNFEFKVDMAVIPTSITLIRALARVDVGLNYSGTSPSGITGKLGKIYLSEVHVYNINKHGAIAPNPTYIAGTQVTQATVPSVADILHKGPIGYVYSTVEQSRLESKADIYLAESRFIEEGDTLCFIVGLWSDKFSATNPNWNLPEGGFEQGRVKTYYRIDAIIGKSHRSILRNHRYRVNIRTVNALGAATIEQAYKSMAVNDPRYVPEGESIDPPLGVDLTITNDLKHITTFGDYFLSLDSHKESNSTLSSEGLVELRSGKEISAKFSTETNHDEGWKVKIADKDALWLSIDGSSTGAKNILADFVVKAKAMTSGYQREGVVILTAGPDLRLTMKVRQINSDVGVVPADTIDLPIYTIPANYMGGINSSIQFYDHSKNNFNVAWNWNIAANVRQGAIDSDTPPESAQQYPAYQNSCTASYKDGHRNWRLPTKIEAELMIKYAQNDLTHPSLGTTFSATTNPEDKNQAQYITGKVEGPSVQNINKTGGNYNYQCIRDVDQVFYTTTGNPKMLKGDKEAKDTLVFYATKGLTLTYEKADAKFDDIISNVVVTKEKDIDHNISKWIIETTTREEFPLFTEDKVTFINIKAGTYEKRVRLTQGATEIDPAEYIIPNIYSKLGYDLEFASSDLKLTNWYLAANVPGATNEIDTPPGGIQVEDHTGLNGSRPGSCADWGSGRGEASGWRMPTGDELKIIHDFAGASNRLGLVSNVYVGADIYNLATNVKGYQFTFGLSGLSDTERKVSVDKLVRRGTYADYSIRCVKVANNDFYTLPNSIKLGLYAETKVIFVYSKHGVDPVYAKGPNFDKIVSSISAPVASGGVKNDGFQLWEITVKFNDAILYDATATSLTIQAPGGAFSSQIIISQDGYGTAVSDEDMELPYKLEVTLDDYKDGTWYYAANVPYNYISTSLPHKEMQFMGEHNTPDGSYMGSCSSLRMGGHSGWRLATMKELKALHNSGYFAPQSESNKYYMSSETSLANTSQYRAMYRGDTTQYTQGKTSTSSSSKFLTRRCVRHLEFFEDPTIALYFGSATETKSIFISTKHNISTTNIDEGVGFSDVVLSYTINHISTAADNLQTWKIEIVTKEVVNQARDQVTLTLKSDDGSNLERAITISKDGNYIVPSENILIATKNQIAKLGILKPVYNNWYNYANVAQNNTSITTPPTPQLQPKDPYSCAALNFDGHDNWRLPTIKELAGIYSQFMKNGGIHMFGTIHRDGVKSFSYWSIESANASLANSISFDAGTHINQTKTNDDGLYYSDSYSARCVRDLDLFIGHDLMINVGYYSMTKSITVYSNYALPSIVTITDPQFAELVSSVTTRHISTTSGVQKWELTITSKDAIDLENRRETMDIISPDGGRAQRLVVIQEGRMYAKSANIVFAAEDQPRPYRTWYVYNNVKDNDTSITPTQLSPAREGSCAAYREGGYDDWRLPTLDELVKSREYFSEAGIPLNELGFLTYYYLTSNTSVFYTSSASYYLGYNIINGSTKKTDDKGRYVDPARCVRSANFFTDGEHTVRFGANSRAKSLYIKTAHGLSATVGKDANYATVVDDLSMTLEETKNGLESWKLTFTPKNSIDATALVKTELTFTPSQPSGSGLDQVITLYLDGRYIIENLNIVVADEDYEPDFKTTWYGYSNTNHGNNDAINLPPVPQIYPERERSCAARRDGGYTTWRVPKLSEVIGFISHFRAKESNILEAFGVREGYSYITGTTALNNPTSAEFYVPAITGVGGSAEILDKGTSFRYYVRCIRDIDYFEGGVGHGLSFGQHAETQRLVINLPAGESFANSFTPTGPDYGDIVDGVTLTKTVTNPDGSTVWHLDVTSKRAAVPDTKRATYLTLTSETNSSSTKRVAISQDSRYHMTSLGLDLAMKDILNTWYVVNNIPDNINNAIEPPSPQESPAREGSCAALQESAFGDWRVPTLVEIRAIRALLATTPGLGAELGFTYNYYWSSTPYQSDISQAHIAYITGTNERNYEKTYQVYTRCVRDLGFFYGKEKSLNFGHNGQAKSLHLYTDYAINTTPIKDSKFNDILESVAIEFVQNLPNGSQEWKITATSKDALYSTTEITELTLSDSDGQGLSQKVIITRDATFHRINIGIDLSSSPLPTSSWYTANNIADGVDNESFPPAPQVVPARTGSCAAYEEEGFKDWRVPTFNELTEMSNYYNSLSAADKAKLNFSSSDHWSSNTVAGSPSVAQCRYVVGTSSSSAYAKSIGRNIRCIRDMNLFTGAKDGVYNIKFGTTEQTITKRFYSKRPLDVAFTKGVGFHQIVKSATVTSAGSLNGLDAWDITVAVEDATFAGEKSVTMTFGTTDASGLTETIHIVQEAFCRIINSGLDISRSYLPGSSWYVANNIADGVDNESFPPTPQVVPARAGSCAAYREGGFESWRVPTSNELTEMYNYYNSLSVGDKAKLNFSSGDHWSSNTVAGSPSVAQSRYVVGTNSNTYAKSTGFNTRCVRDMLCFTGANRTVRIGIYGDESVTTRVYSKRPLDNGSFVKGAGFDNMVASLVVTPAGTTTSGLDIWDITVTPKNQTISGLYSTTATLGTTDASGATEAITIVQDARYILSKDGVTITFAPEDQRLGHNWYTHANIAQGNNKNDAILTDQLSPPVGVSCAGLSVAGYENWRLPTVVELQTFYTEYTATGVAEMGFVVSTKYWSSESRISSNTYAHSVNMSNGAIDFDYKTDRSFRTRCVRDPNLFEAPLNLSISVGAAQERRVLTLYSSRGLNTTFSTGGSYAAIVESATITHKGTSVGGIGRYELVIISKSTTYQPIRSGTITLTPTDGSGKSQVVTITQDARFVLPSGVYVTKGSASDIDVTRRWHIAANTTDANNSSGAIPPLPQVLPARVGSCAGVTEGGIAGWRLPTIAELTAMRAHFIGIGTLADFGFQDGLYWSIESDANLAQAKRYRFDTQTTTLALKTNANYIRCVRDPEFFSTGTTTAGLGFGSAGSTQTLRVYTNQGINATYTPGTNFANLIADVKIVKDISMGSASYSFWDIIVTSKDAKVFSATPDATTITLHSADGAKTKVVNISINRKNIIKERAIYLASNDLVNEETLLATSSWYRANNVVDRYVSARDEEYPTAINQEVPARKSSCASQKDGYTNWRVPTLGEILMVRDHVFANGGLVEFNLISAAYWTSSSYSTADGIHYSMYNSDSRLGKTTKTNSIYTRCVRDITFFQDIEANIQVKSNSYVRRFYVASDRAIASGFTEDLSGGMVSLVSSVNVTHVRTEGTIQYWYVDVTTKNSTSSATPSETGRITIKSEDGVKSQLIGIVRDNRLLMSESNIMMSSRDQFLNTWYITANIPDANTSVEVPPQPQQAPARVGSCAALREGGYSNWRMPSEIELGAMYTHIKGTGDWLDYWGISSTVYNTIVSSGPSYIYSRRLSSGESSISDKGSALLTRCVRDLSWFEGATVKMRFNTERLTQKIEIPTSYGLSEAGYDTDANYASIVEAMSLKRVKTEGAVEYWQITVTSKDAIVSGINQTVVTFYSADRTKTQAMTITQDGRYFIADMGFIVAEKDAINLAGSIMTDWYMLNNVGSGNTSTTYPPTPQISPEMDGSCAASRTAGYANWRLPQIHELKAMHSYFNSLGGYSLWGFNSTYYWSGSSFDNNNAYYLPFSTGVVTTVTKNTTSQMQGRCIRNVNWFEGHTVKMEFGVVSSKTYMMASTIYEIARYEKGTSFDDLISSVEFELLKKEGDVFYYGIDVTSKDAKRTAPVSTTIEFKSADNRTQTVTVSQDRLLIDEATGHVFAGSHHFSGVTYAGWYQVNNVAAGNSSMEEPPLPQEVPARKGSCAEYKEGEYIWGMPNESQLLSFHAQTLALVGEANLKQYFNNDSYWSSTSASISTTNRYTKMNTATPYKTLGIKSYDSFQSSVRCMRRHNIFNGYPVKASIRVAEMTTMDITTREGIISHQAGSNFSSLLESVSYERIGVMENGAEVWRLHFNSKPPTAASANMTAQLVLKGANGGSQTVDVIYLKSETSNAYYISASNLTVAKADIRSQTWYVMANVADGSSSIAFPPVPQISPARTGSCAAYVEGGMGGWRMPSQNELMAIFNHFNTFGGYQNYDFLTNDYYHSGESSDGYYSKSVRSSSSPSTRTSYKSTAYPTRCVKAGGNALVFVEFYDTPRAVDISYIGGEDGAEIVYFTTKLGANTAIVAGDKGANYDNVVASTTISISSTAADGTQRYQVKIVPNQAVTSGVYTTTLKIRSTSGARSQFINITQNARFLLSGGLMMATKDLTKAYWNVSSNTSTGNNTNSTTYPPMPQYNPPLAGSCAASSEGGFTDWRMPSWSELKAIGTYAVSSGLNFNTDLNMPNGYYFSGETISTNTWYASGIAVNTTTYTEEEVYKRSEYNARCVRGPSVFDADYTKTMEIGMSAVVYASDVYALGDIHTTDYIKGPGFDDMVSKVGITKIKSFGLSMSLYRIDLTAKPNYTGAINNTTITLNNQAKTKTQLITIVQDGRYIIPSSRVQIAKSDLADRKSDGSLYSWYEIANTPDNNSDESTPPMPQLKPARAGSCAAYSEGGITGWRMPTIDELRKIEAHFNSLGGIKSFGLGNNAYWSIETYPDDQYKGDQAYYWEMRTSTGYASEDNKTPSLYSSARVRCVRNS